MVVDSSADTELELGTGGMATKLDAARIAISAGENVVIANGRRDNVLAEILAGEDIGTLILAKGRTVASRKRWIGWTANARGKLILDEGACRAIESNGKSLLSVGVTSVDGTFRKGDVVVLTSADGREIARGLTNYSSEETRIIAGVSTEQIEALLGHCPYDEVIHRDNLVLVG